MPDGGSPRSIVFRRATRGIVSPLILLTGGSGTGKSYSMMRLMRGYVGPEGRIFIIDTDNGRARLYADEFDFFHYDLQPPFRPRDFEAAIIEAQKQKADIIGVDNISHEHYATNEYHDEEVQRLSRGDPARAEAVKMLAWVKPKVEHKHLFLTAYRARYGRVPEGKSVEIVTLRVPTASSSSS
jgi:predicted ATP-dependent serine protease